MGRGFGSDEAARGAFGGLERQEQLKRLFEEPLSPPSGATWSPLVDITDTGSAFRLSAEVPGMERDDLDIDLRGNVLVLRGERSGPTDTPDVRYHQVERPGGIFQRTFRLPEEVDGDRVVASLENGVLQLELPKRCAEKPVAIPITGTASPKR